jgi:multiple sugar transport system permease protein
VTAITSSTAATVSPRKRLQRAVWHLVCAALVVAMLYPVVWLVAMSFKPANEIISGLNLLPEKIVLGNYQEALRDVVGVPFWRLVVNSLLVSGLAMVGNIVACTLAAYAFARMRFRLRGPMFAFMIASIMLPHHVVLIPQYTLFNKLDMVGSILPLVLPKFLATDAFFIFLIVQFMRGLPSELGDAARIDGCGPIRAFVHVFLPLTKPALITTGIFTFIWTWNDFLSQVIYLNDRNWYTLPMALSLYVDQTSETSYGAMFAMSVLSLVPIGLFFFAFQRYLVAGVSTSGLSGT